MSRAGRTLASSQVAQSRAPPDGSSISGLQRESQEEEFVESRGDAPIPPSAVTSSTSRPRRSVMMERRKSNVTFAPAPSLAPSDSISRVRTRETVASGHDDVQERRYSRATGKAPSQTSGSGAPLTENNLERLNEAPAIEAAAVETQQAVEEPPRSDEQEAPLTSARTSRRNSRRYSRATNADGPSRRASKATTQRSSGQYMATVEDDDERRGSRATTRRTSREYSSKEVDDAEGERRYSNATSRRSSRRKSGAVNETQAETSSRRQSSAKSGALAAGATAVAADAVVEEAESSSKSRRQSVAASKNVIDINETKSVSRETTRRSGPTPSQVIASPPSAVSSSAISPKDITPPIRKDSMSPTAAQSSREVKETTIEADEAVISSAKAPSKPSSRPQSVGKSSSPTAPSSPLMPGQWERKTVIITKRYPNGKEVREREIRIQKCPPAAA